MYPLKRYSQGGGPKSAPVSYAWKPRLAPLSGSLVKRPVRFFVEIAGCIYYEQEFFGFLTTPAEVEIWLTAEAPDALALQRPLPDEALRIVAKGEREDGARERQGWRLTTCSCRRRSRPWTPQSGGKRP